MPILHWEASTARGKKSTLTVTRGETMRTYTLGEIARACQLGTSTLSRLFNGQRTGRVQTLARIAPVLRVSIDVLNRYLQTKRPFARR